MDPKDRKENDEEFLNEVFTNAQEDAIEMEEMPDEDTQEEESSEDDDSSAKFCELEDKYLRLAAEFDNYRKRTIKEKAEIIKSGGEKVISCILPVLDDMERAIKTMQETDDIDAIKAGIELIYEKFQNILIQNGLQKINTSEDADFDTDYHEAIALVPAPSGSLKGKILDTVQNGYMLNDKVIRHAKVVVGE